MLYTLPIISALIGWITNFIAVKMLFHPKEEINLIIFKLHGIFPKRQNELAENLGRIVAQELVSISDIKEKLVGSTDNSDIEGLLEEHLDTFLRTKLVDKMPMLQMFLNEEMVEKIKSTLLTEFKEFMPVMIDKYMEKVENINIEGIVAEKVRKFSSDKLEEILFSIMKKEFRFIEFLGGVLGFIIGLIQMLIVKFAVL